MKTIASLSGPDFLRASYKASTAASVYLKKTKLLDLKAAAAGKDIPEDATPEERDAALEKIGSDMVHSILEKAMNDYAEDTWELLTFLILPEKDGDGNDLPLDGMDALMAATELLTTPKVFNFFTKLISSVLKNTKG